MGSVTVDHVWGFFHSSSELCFGQSLKLVGSPWSCGHFN